MFGNILASLKTYQQAWEVVEEGKMAPEEIALITKCEVVPSTYGISLKLYRKDGSTSFVPVDEEHSNLCIGDKPVLSELTFVLLTKSGEEIYRVR